MPEVVAVGVSGDDVRDGVPVVLTTFLPGRALAAPDVERLAAAIRRDVAGLWETAIELWFDAVPQYQPTFVHRDFHPGRAGDDPAAPPPLTSRKGRSPFARVGGERRENLGDLGLEVVAVRAGEPVDAGVVPPIRRRGILVGRAVDDR